jgi:3-isopropylmalate/(R)-2-methylmalate dehydratase small subunit
MNQAKHTEIAGRAVSVTGNDIDTDQILPGRFLNAITFQGFEAHVFADLRARGGHPFDDARFTGANILLVNENFGCGSSREHAPQALKRWGIQAIVGVSFGEIFAGNCLSIGIACVRVDAATAAELQAFNQADPTAVFTLDLDGKTLRAGARSYPAAINEGPRQHLIAGTWDALGVLLEAEAAIEQVAGQLERPWQTTAIQ